MKNTSGLGQAKNQANIKAGRIKTHLLLEGGSGGGGVWVKNLFTSRRPLDGHLPWVFNIAIHNMVMRYVKSCGKRR